MMKEIGRGSTTITKNRFLNDHELTEITIAEDVRTISDSAFEGCEKLQTVHFSEGLRRLSKGAFRGCVALRGVKLPQSVVSIQANVFSGCVGLETVILPEDLRRNIERGTFADCKKLQHIDIPAGLSKICTGAFGNCKALQTVCFKSDDILIEDDAFRGCESLSDDARDYIEKHTIEHDVIDIISDGRNEAGRLSNFTARSFVFDGIECGSIEGVLQSFKCSDTDVQREICKLAGGAAKNAGETHSNWMIGQTLYWQGVEYPRNSSDYQLLLDRLYDAVYEQDEGFRRDLAAISQKKFDHSIGNSDMRRTVLTRKEFVGELRRLIKENIGRSGDQKI